MFFLRQCLIQRIKVEKGTEITGKREENIRRLTKQHTICREYHGSDKIKLSHKLILHYWFAFHTKTMKGPNLE